MQSKTTKTLLIGALVLSNAFWIYRMFDNGVSLTYMEASFESAEQAREQTEVLANLSVVGRTADDVVALLSTDIHGLEPFEKEGCLYYGWVCLQLNEQRVIVAVGKDNE
jgi:hypothetical protein